MRQLNYLRYKSFCAVHDNVIVGEENVLRSQNTITSRQSNCLSVGHKLMEIWRAGRCHHMTGRTWIIADQQNIGHCRH